MLPSGHRVVGLRPVDGMPHQSLPTRSLDSGKARDLCLRRAQDRMLGRK